MNTIPAIPTEYKGVRFRSRTEARWAVFFDALGVPWRYEPEGYDLPSGKYLPDFFLPTVQGGLFVEVKGATPTDQESQSCNELATATGRHVLLVIGSPPESEGETRDRLYTTDQRQSFVHYVGSNMVDWPHLFCECPVCHRVGVEYAGYGDRICDDHPGQESRVCTAFTDRLMAAAREANTYRFWN